MEFRAHGANPDKLYEQFGVAMPERVFDFSTNTNAVPRGPGFAPDIHAALEDYPDDGCCELRRLIAAQTGAAEEEILATSGANEGIYLLASILADRRNLICQPVYGEYARALAGFGNKAENISDLFETELPHGAAVWLCNPCNPTGAYIEERRLDPFIKSHPDNFFIIDEAYRDFVWGRKTEARPAAAENAVRLRSLTKTYCLCGARIGYILAASALIERLKARQPSWSVPNLAQQAALFYMKDETLAERTRLFYAAEMPRLIAAVEAAGFQTLPTSANFFLMETEDDEALIAFLLKKGVVVRHTRNFPGLDGRFVRIAARAPEENDILTAALRAFRAEASQ